MKQYKYTAKHSVRYNLTLHPIMYKCNLIIYIKKKVINNKDYNKVDEKSISKLLLKI